jgi:hypothetical protein
MGLQVSWTWQWRKESTGPLLGIGSHNVASSYQWLPICCTGIYTKLGNFNFGLNQSNTKPTLHEVQKFIQYKTYSLSQGSSFGIVAGLWAWQPRNWVRFPIRAKYFSLPPTYI